MGTVPPAVEAKRRTAIGEARKRLKDTDVLSQKELAEIWGVTPARMCSVIGNWHDFPTATRAGKEHHYPAHTALDYMLGTIKKKRAASSKRHARLARIMGATDKVTSATHPGDDEDDDLPLAPTELLALTRVRAETWKLQKEMGMYVPLARAVQLFTSIGTMLSREIASFPGQADPNGQLPPAVRKRLDDSSRDLLLRIHEHMGDMLAPDGDGTPQRAADPRGAVDVDEPRARVRRSRRRAAAAA